MEQLKFNLILVRHAHYKPYRSLDLPLSEDGLEQAKCLAQKIKEEVGQDDITIWTSTAQRAKDTALAVKSELFLVKEFQEFEKLWSGYNQDFKWLLNKLQNAEITGTLIIVTHQEYVRVFPRYLGFKRNEASYAEGIVIKNNEIKIISWH